VPALPIQTHTTGGHTLTKVDDGNPFDPKSLEGIGWRKADLAMSGPKTVTRKLLGFQFGNREGHSIQGDNNDPSGLFSFEIGPVRNVVGIRSGIISSKLIISYYAARSNC
jgi:hypothetical protein